MPAAAAGGERVTEMISRDVFRESVRKQTFPRRAGVPTIGYDAQSQLQPRDERDEASAAASLVGPARELWR